ncbi:MAG: 3,4-dihydroxy-2-butanone-4-phosphate synthase [Candidatus Micrarchaeota archaeon]
MDNVEKAVSELKKGKMILIYDGDGREGEADLVFGAEFAKPEYVEILRKDAGGLICLAVAKERAGRLGLEFYADILESSNSKLKGMKCNRTAYGDKPSFSISVNHKRVYTGIPDNDRALTIKEISKTKTKDELVANFYTPGHVFLLIGRGIENRKGHTELSLELGKRAGIEMMVLCEMLGKGNALPKKEIKEYAEKNKLVLIEGKEIIEG